MKDNEIDAQIEILRNKMKIIKSHIGKIELQNKISELQAMKLKNSEKESWEM